MCVLKEDRGKGHETKVLQELELWCRELVLKNYILETENNSVKPLVCTKNTPLKLFLIMDTMLLYKVVFAFKKRYNSD